MARAKKQGAAQGTMSEEMTKLQGLLGGDEVSNGFVLDGGLLAMVVQLLTRKGCAFQVGTSMDRQQVTFKVWDSGFPAQFRATTTEEANETIRRIAQAYCPKGEAWDEVRAYLEAWY